MWWAGWHAHLIRYLLTNLVAFSSWFNIRNWSKNFWQSLLSCSSKGWISCPLIVPYIRIVIRYCLMFLRFESQRYKSLYLSNSTVSSAILENWWRWSSSLFPIYAPQQARVVSLYLYLHRNNKLELLVVVLSLWLNMNEILDMVEHGDHYMSIKIIINRY